MNVDGMDAVLSDVRKTCGKGGRGVARDISQAEHVCLSVCLSVCTSRYSYTPLQILISSYPVLRALEGSAGGMLLGEGGKGEESGRGSMQAILNVKLLQLQLHLTSLGSINIHLT
jgi:hypothetical protein